LIQGKFKMTEELDVLVVQKGDSGEAVMHLQGLLNSYDRALLEADGEFGDNTELAVKAFQRKSGLEDDGIVGAATWEALQALTGASDEVVEGC
jgi:peptidoglycan hydrolase-like protein with peptidoglycan-binding domain